MIDKFYFAMEIGGMFFTMFGSTTDEWSASEECAEYCNRVAEVFEKGFSREYAMCKVYCEMMDGDIRGEDHGWDDFTRGFICGQNFGVVTNTSIDKAKAVEKRWKADSRRKEPEYGYYQDACF